MHPLLEMKNVCKAFRGVKALGGVDFDLYPGEVHALLGENGAGKSTLIKILGGFFHPDEGELLFDGEQINLDTPRTSRDLGIRIVHQELNLVETISIAENIFIERLPTSWMNLSVSWKKLMVEANEVLDKLQMNLKPEVLVKDLSIGEKQMVEIARAVSANARVVVMDEPTAALSNVEIETLYKLIRSMKQHGIAIIYISHRLDELFEIADRVTVIRDGKKIGDRDIKETNKDELVSMMVGRTLENMFPKICAATDKPLFRVRNLTTKGQISHLNFSINQGEILGVYGIAGAGQDELAKALIGAYPVLHGEMELEEQKLNIESPIHALRHGIGLAPLERKLEGLVLGRSIKENITMSTLKKYFRNGVLNTDMEEANAKKWVAELNIRTPSHNQQVGNLSGGNQQKVVLARLMETNSRIIILNEPTRGIDVGAKVEVYLLLEKLCAEGRGILMLSTDMLEILAIPDRIMVLSRGKISGTFTREEATQEKILKCAIGETVDHV